MPYIEKEARELLDLETSGLNPSACSAGDMNYLITSLLLRHLGPNPSYRDFNEAIGILECSKLELYRRMVAPHEDKKAAENGDVFDD